MKKTDTAAQPAVRFSKEQLITSKRFAHRRDLLRAVLKDNARYSIKEAERAMEEYMKGKVK